MSALRILVTGSRDWSDWHTVEVALRHAYLQFSGARLPDEVVVVHGGARGADACAAVLAPRMGFRVEVHPADWERYGKSAGHRRNAEMVAAGADVCLAFPIRESPGTRGCVRLAMRAGIPVKIHEGDLDWRPNLRESALTEMVEQAEQLGLYESTADPLPSEFRRGAVPGTGEQP